MSLVFKKAERKQAKLKIALTGPSGSGKTMSSLLIAKGIGGRIALIDTENKSASLYADRFDFDTLEIEPPYTTEKYIEAMNAAVASKYDVIIVDSISHQWSGEGGILDRKGALDSRPGSNSYTNWSKMTPEQEKFKSILLHLDSHLICTMRSKQAYILEANDKGKQAPRKVGMEPIQREGMEYEFTTVLDLGMDHSAKASKDRTGIFKADEIFRINESTGKGLIEWINSGKKEVPFITDHHRNEIKILFEDVKRDFSKIDSIFLQLYNKNFHDISKEEYENFLKRLQKEKEKLENVK